MKLIKFALRHSKRLVLLSVAAGIITGASSTALVALINATIAREHQSGAALMLYYSFRCYCIMQHTDHI